MRVAVIGANGQLGCDVTRAFMDNGDDVCQVGHAEMELSDADSVSETILDLRPEVIVNTAAMHHVESCEQKPEKAFAVNGLGPKYLALSARDVGAVIIHISTDYVFDGLKGSAYDETDRPFPLNVYGKTKLAGEDSVRATSAKHFVLRTSAIYGTNPCRGKGGLNFVELMLKIARERGRVRVVDNEFVTPTPTKDIARQIVRLSRSEAYGLYHATAEGACSWYDFAHEIFALTNTDVVLEAADPDEFPSKVPRPKYSVLENRGLKTAGLNEFSLWQTGLGDYLKERTQWTG